MTKYVYIMDMHKGKPSRPYDFRIDRDSLVGNPEPLMSEKDRDKVCDDYEEYFKDVVLTTKSKRNYLHEIQMALEIYGKVRLFCWCYPRRCHGETIKRWLLRRSK